MAADMLTHSISVPSFFRAMAPLEDGGIVAKFAQHAKNGYNMRRKKNYLMSACGTKNPGNGAEENPAVGTDQMRYSSTKKYT